MKKALCQEVQRKSINDEEYLNLRRHTLQLRKRGTTGRRTSFTSSTMSKLVDDMTNSVARKEEEREEIEIHQESILQVINPSSINQ